MPDLRHTCIPHLDCIDAMYVSETSQEMIAEDVLRDGDEDSIAEGEAEKHQRRADGHILWQGWPARLS